MSIRQVRALVCGGRFLPAEEGDDCPDGFDKTEGPCALKEAVDRAEDTRDGEGEDEPAAAALEGVADQHAGDGEEAEEA